MLTVNHKQITTTPEGYLSQLEDWSPDVATEIAKQDGLILSAAHWEIIHFLRDFYQEYEHTPAIRALVKALANKFGPDKGNSLYLHQLFPQGPVKQASKIAGLPKPSRCI